MLCLVYLLHNKLNTLDPLLVPCSAPHPARPHYPYSRKGFPRELILENVVHTIGQFGPLLDSSTSVYASDPKDPLSTL